MPEQSWAVKAPIPLFVLKYVHQVCLLERGAWLDANCLLTSPLSRPAKSWVVLWFATGHGKFIGSYQMSRHDTSTFPVLLQIYVPPCLNPGRVNMKRCANRII